jgi:hypothetical protein
MPFEMGLFFGGERTAKFMIANANRLWHFAPAVK